MPPPLPPVNRGSNAGTFIAVLLLLMCAGGLFLLVMMVNPFIAGLLVIPMVLGPLAVFQYLLWGRWLDRMKAEHEAHERDAK